MNLFIKIGPQLIKQYSMLKPRKHQNNSKYAQYRKFFICFFKALLFVFAQTHNFNKLFAKVFNESQNANDIISIITKNLKIKEQIQLKCTNKYFNDKIARYFFFVSFFLPVFFYFILKLHMCFFCITDTTRVI